MLESVLSEKFGGGPFLLQHVYQLQGICTTNTLTGPHPDCQTEIESQQDLSWVQYQSSLSWINIPTDTYFFPSSCTMPKFPKILVRIVCARHLPTVCHSPWVNAISMALLRTKTRDNSNSYNPFEEPNTSLNHREKGMF